MALVVRQGIMLLDNIALTQELAHKENHFRSLVQGSSDVIMIAAPTGVLRYVSPAAHGCLRPRPGGAWSAPSWPPTSTPTTWAGCCTRCAASWPRRPARSRPPGSSAGSAPAAARPRARDDRARARRGPPRLAQRRVQRHPLPGRPDLQQPRRHRTGQAPGPVAAQRLARPAHRPAQPGAVPRAARPGAGRPPGRRRPAPPCSTSTSTASRRSTTRSATRRATTCWCRPPAGSGTPCGPATPRPGSAATSSPPCICGRRRPRPGAARERQIRDIADRLRAALSEPYRVDGIEVRVGASIGIAFAEPGATPGEIMRHADLAMYRAKQAGKGRVELYAPRLQSDAVRRTELAGRVRKALDDGEFTLLHQPVVELAGGRIAGVEARARWRSAAGRPVHPGRVPARRRRHRARLGDRAAGCWSRRWSRPRCATARATASPSPSGSPPAACCTATRPPPVSRTCSPGTSCRPSGLVVELPGGDPEIAPEELERRLAGLRRLGVRIALAGFAGGFGALGALRTLPVDVIKLDRAFTEGVVESARLHKITSGLLRHRRRPRHPGRRRRRRPARAGPDAARDGLPARPRHGVRRPAGGAARCAAR